MFALALASLAPAHAVGFNQSDLPATMPFAFDWTSAGVSGQTDFTFATGTEVTNGICGGIHAASGNVWCMNGTFTTANLGAGDYTTRLRRESCSTQLYFVLLGFVRVQTCSVFQDLEATYDVTGAVYDGTSTLGIARRFKAWFLWEPEPASFGSFRYFLDSPGLFQGVLSGPGTGTFSELP